jgi:hypothetical protein
MKRQIWRALALACALAVTPACAALRPLAESNPVAVAETADQKAYALVMSYAAVLEIAARRVADPATPPEVKAALARAERIATPAVDALRVAIVAYLRARADYETRVEAGAPARDRAAAAFAAAAAQLDGAIAAARAPLAAFADAVRAGQGV